LTGSQNFTPKSLTASEYILALFEPSDNIAVLLRDPEHHRILQHIATAESVADPDYQSWLAERNRSGSDVFLGMNPLKEGATTRTKGSIKEIRHLYLDLDEDAAKSLAVIRDSANVPPPNFVLDTSPGKHQVVWKIEGIDQEQAESLLRSMANEFGGDSAATDSTRVLRMPGFVNRKYAPQEEFIVRVRQESDEVYRLRNFTVQEDSPDTPRRIEDAHLPSRAAARRPKTQSEHDWAYAKRALARGDDPELVAQRIADYRGNEKHPSYARLTVTKAQEALNKRENDEAEPPRSPEAGRQER